MATRSHIGKRLEDGNIKWIYCHWDGYPSHNGKILENHYTTEEKVDELLKLGDLSILGPEIGEKQDFDDASAINDDWCLAYGRDRGEINKGARTTNEKQFKSGWAEYFYIFENGKWTIHS